MKKLANISQFESLMGTSSCSDQSVFNYNDKHIKKVEDSIGELVGAFGKKLYGPAFGAIAGSGLGSGFGPAGTVLGGLGGALAGSKLGEPLMKGVGRFPLAVAEVWEKDKLSSGMRKALCKKALEEFKKQLDLMTVDELFDLIGTAAKKETPEEMDEPRYSRTISRWEPDKETELWVGGTENYLDDLMAKLGLDTEGTVDEKLDAIEKKLLSMEKIPNLQ